MHLTNKQIYLATKVSVWVGRVPIGRCERGVLLAFLVSVSSKDVQG